jgi:hypothetical protein
MKERCGNAGAVESVESRRQASHSFHEPLGNLATGQARFPHSHSADDEGDGKVENQKQVFHFPTAPSSSLSKQVHKNQNQRRALPADTNERKSPAASTSLLFQAHPALE